MLKKELMEEARGGFETYQLKPDPHSSHSVILRWLGTGNGRRALDVGAADGFLSRHLTERDWKVTALERDPRAAEAGKACCERMVTVDLDRGLPDLEGLFDAIVYGDVLEHLADPLQVLTGLNRLLAPEGEVMISVPNVAHLWVRLCLLAGRFDYLDRGILDATHLRFFTERSLRALVHEAGLTIVRQTATPVPLYHVVPMHFHGRSLALIHGLSAAFARTLPRVLGYQFLVLARAREAAS